jgi:O-antigen/teichoic acid export membrane protein
VQLVQLVIVTVLWRELPDADYAAVVLAYSVSAIVTLFMEMGISVALIRRSEDDTDATDSAFALSVLLSLGVVAVVLASASLMARAYALPQLPPVLRHLSVAYVFQGLSAVPRCLLLRRFHFGGAMRADVLGAVGLLLGVVCGLRLGWGADAFVAGRVTQTGLGLLVLAIAARYVPRGRGSVPTMRQLLGFGAGVSVNRVLNAAGGEFDKLLMGGLASNDALGLYFWAQRVTRGLPALVTAAIDQTALPVYASIGADTERAERVYWQSLRSSVLVALPLGAGLFAASEPLLWLFRGEAAAEHVAVMQLLSAAQAVGALGGGIFASLVYAKGDLRVMFWASVFRVAALPICILGGSPFGLVGFAVGYFVYCLAGRVYNQFQLSRAYGLSMGAFLHQVWRPVAIASASVAAVLAVNRFVAYPDSRVGWLVEAVAVALATTLLCCLLYARLLPEDWRLTSRAVRDASASVLAGRRERAIDCSPRE